MQTYHVGLLALAIFSLLGLFAFGSWRSRVKRQESSIQQPQSIIGDASGVTAFYVATTFAGRPLDRVVAHGLAHRGRAKVLVSSLGVSVYRLGESSFLIPSADIVRVRLSNAVIDRVVEKEGLVSIEWNLGDTAVDTHLRFVSSSERMTALAQLEELVA